MNNVAKRKKSPGAIFRERSEPEGRVSGMIRANSVKKCVRRSCTQHAAKPRYRFHSIRMFTTYSILPIYRACRDARRRVETGVSPCQKGGARGIPIRLPIFRYALLWCAAHSVTHLMCAPSFAPSTPRLPKNILRSPTFARTRATDSSHTSHRLLGGVSRRRCPSHTTVIVRRRNTAWRRIGKRIQLAL